MTENLLQKLEEKMMLLLSELEDLRKKNQRLQDDNSRLQDNVASLEDEKQFNTKKIESILGLIDYTVHTGDSVANANVATMKPVLIQNQAL